MMLDDKSLALEADLLRLQRRARSLRATIITTKGNLADTEDQIALYEIRLGRHDGSKFDPSCGGVTWNTCRNYRNRMCSVCGVDRSGSRPKLDPMNQALNFIAQSQPKPTDDGGQKND